ncbi:hypothetical protein RR46_05627 [Papilio xuthus]|uniref:Uncharacterized protein n=1 Tax=Papilio xuthus TaxID=66420 RepID=A0A194Q0S7_PAPXU|nr:hypothetical protein RR46_05627 [Papilio xuthus]
MGHVNGEHDTSPPWRRNLHSEYSVPRIPFIPFLSPVPSPRTRDAYQGYYTRWVGARCPQSICARALHATHIIVLDA